MSEYAGSINHAELRRPQDAELSEALLNEHGRKMSNVSLVANYKEHLRVEDKVYYVAAAPIPTEILVPDDDNWAVIEVWEHSGVLNPNIPIKPGLPTRKIVYRELAYRGKDVQRTGTGVELLYFRGQKDVPVHAIDGGSGTVSQYWMDDVLAFRVSEELDLALDMINGLQTPSP